MRNTERVHLLFRGGAEVTKALRRGAIACECVAAAIALLVILWKPKDRGATLPLAVFLITFIGMALRSYSSVAKAFSQRCRRLSLRAFCTSQDVDPRVAATIEDDAPLCVEYFANRLPDKALQDYYEPTMPPGARRFVELYAHSAFYTWRQLRIQAWITFGVGFVVAAACVLTIYRLAAQPEIQVDRHSVLEAICTVILLVIAAKGLEAWWETYRSYREIREIEAGLLKIPDGDELRDKIDAYDIERAAGADPWTIIYRILRNKLSSVWNERRKAVAMASQEEKDVSAVTSN